MLKLSRYRFHAMTALGLAAGWVSLTDIQAVPGPALPADTMQVPSKPPRGDTARTSGAAAALARLPLSFEANRGQTDASVKFISRGSGYTLYLTSTEAVLALKTGRTPAVTTSQHISAPLSTADARQVLRMQLAGSNTRSAIEGLEPLPGRVNYFRVGSPQGRHENVPTYRRVRYRSVYPGVDMIYYGNDGSLEYDFVVSPGASPDQIRLKFDGAERLDIDPGGDLVVRTAGGEVRLRKPMLYQDKDGKRRAVAGRYVVGGDVVGFEVGPFDPRAALVIDPVLLYSSFLGGSLGDSGGGVALDGAGNIYVTGTTSSLNFPVATTAQPFKAGGSDAFVTKLNPSGTTLLYSTYLGGDGDDAGNGIAVDSTGTAYITGVLDSADRTNASVLVAKFAPSGANIYAQFFGASGDDIGYAVAFDSLGYAYVTGQTGAASDFPITPGAFQSVWNGFNDAFLSVLTPDGTGLVYSTYLGGGLGDEGRAIALDAAGDAYVAGMTQGGFPTTAGAYQTELLGFGDAFIVKFRPYLSGAASVAWSTLLGGSDFEVAHSIVVDPAGNSYVTGSTTSSGDFPATAGAFQTLAGGGNCGTVIRFLECQDAFVTKLNSAGSGLIYSTYLGGLGHDFGNGIALDAGGNAYVTGQAFAHNFPVNNAVQPTKGGGNDAFVTKVNAAGSGLTYSTYLGGSFDDTGRAVAVNSAGTAYVVGTTDSGNFPTVAAFQAAYGGNSDSFIAKIGDSSCTYSISPASQSFTSAAGTGAITVTAPAGCAWTATSSAGWITVTAGTGTGNGSVSYSVAANTSTTPRSGSISIADQTFSVNQAGAEPPPCTFSISPASQSFVSVGGTGSITVTASATSCAWTTTNSLSWVAITSGSGTGSGTATYTVASNSSTTPRSGTFTVAGKVFDVSQAGASGGAISVTVTAPNGGENLYTGTAFRIDWTATGPVTQFDVESSSNGGVSYSPVTGCTGLGSAARSCTWASPAPATTNGRVRVIARDGGGVTAADASNAAFTIAAGTASITVTFPNTNVNAGIGSLQQVAWNHNLGTEAYVVIELSRDGGLTYPEVVSSPVKNTAGTKGTFSWRVSGPATTGAQARIRVSWANGPANDTSNVNFTIAPVFIKVTTPKTGGSWGFGTTQKQVWTSNLGALDLVHVQLSTSGSAGPFTTLPGGANIAATKKTANVTAPATATTTARLAVVWANPPAGGAAQGLNPGNFRIEAPFVTVTVPSAGQVWTPGVKAAISWTNNLGAAESVKIELSKDGGATYPLLIVPGTPSDGNHTVTVQSGWGPQTTTRIRISWLGSPSTSGTSGVFTIQP